MNENRSTMDQVLDRMAERSDRAHLEWMCEMSRHLPPLSMPPADFVVQDPRTAHLAAAVRPKREVP